MSETASNSVKSLTADEDEEWRKLVGDTSEGSLHSDLALSSSHSALSESGSSLGHAFNTRVQRRALRSSDNDSESDEDNIPSEATRRALMRRRLLVGRLQDGGNSARYKDEAATRIQTVVRGWLAHKKVYGMVLALISQLRGELSSVELFPTSETKSSYAATSTGATSTERTRPDNGSDASLGSFDDRQLVQVQVFGKEQVDQDSFHSLGESEDGETIDGLHFPSQLPVESFQDEDYADPRIPVVPAVENVQVMEVNTTQADVWQEPEVVAAAAKVESTADINAPLLEGDNGENAVKRDDGEAPGWQGSAMASNETLPHDAATRNTVTAGRLSWAALAEDVTSNKGSDGRHVGAKPVEGSDETDKAYTNVDQLALAEKEEPILTSSSLAEARSPLRHLVSNPQQEGVAARMAAREERRNKAATKIQAIARGFKVRGIDVMGMMYAMEWINNYKQQGKPQQGHGKEGGSADGLELSEEAKAALVARRLEMFQSATKIQALARGYICRKFRLQQMMTVIEYLREYRKEQLDAEAEVLNETIGDPNEDQLENAWNFLQSRVVEEIPERPNLSKAFTSQKTKATPATESKVDVRELLDTWEWLKIQSKKRASRVAIEDSVDPSQNSELPSLALPRDRQAIQKQATKPRANELAVFHGWMSTMGLSSARGSTTWKPQMGQDASIETGGRTSKGDITGTSVSVFRDGSIPSGREGPQSSTMPSVFYNKSVSGGIAQIKPNQTRVKGSAGDRDSRFPSKHLAYTDRSTNSTGGDVPQESNKPRVFYDESVSAGGSGPEPTRKTRIFYDESVTAGGNGPEAPRKPRVFYDASVSAGGSLVLSGGGQEQKEDAAPETMANMLELWSWLELQGANMNMFRRQNRNSKSGSGVQYIDEDLSSAYRSSPAETSDRFKTEAGGIQYIDEDLSAAYSGQPRSGDIADVGAQYIGKALSDTHRLRGASGDEDVPTEALNDIQYLDEDLSDVYKLRRGQSRTAPQPNSRKHGQQRVLHPEHELTEVQYLDEDLSAVYQQTHSWKSDGKQVDTLPSDKGHVTNNESGRTNAVEYIDEDLSGVYRQDKNANQRAKYEQGGDVEKQQSGAHVGSNVSHKKHQSGAYTKKSHENNREMTSATIEYLDEDFSDVYQQKTEGSEGETRNSGIHYLEEDLSDVYKQTTSNLQHGDTSGVRGEIEYLDEDLSGVYKRVPGQSHNPSIRALVSYWNVSHETVENVEKKSGIRRNIVGDYARRMEASSSNEAAALAIPERRWAYDPSSNSMLNTLKWMENHGVDLEKDPGSAAVVQDNEEPTIESSAQVELSTVALPGITDDDVEATMTWLGKKGFSLAQKKPSSSDALESGEVSGVTAVEDHHVGKQQMQGPPASSDLADAALWLKRQGYFKKQRPSTQESRANVGTSCSTGSSDGCQTNSSTLYDSNILHSLSWLQKNGFDLEQPNLRTEAGTKQSPKKPPKSDVDLVNPQISAPNLEDMVDALGTIEQEPRSQVDLPHERTNISAATSDRTSGNDMADTMKWLAARGIGRTSLASADASSSRTGTGAKGESPATQSLHQTNGVDETLADMVSPSTKSKKSVSSKEMSSALDWLAKKGISMSKPTKEAPPQDRHETETKGGDADNREAITATATEVLASISSGKRAKGAPSSREIEETLKFLKVQGNTKKKKTVARPPTAQDMESALSYLGKQSKPDRPSNKIVPPSPNLPKLEIEERPRKAKTVAESKKDSRGTSGGQVEGHSTVEGKSTADSAKLPSASPKRDKTPQMTSKPIVDKNSSGSNAQETKIEVPAVDPAKAPPQKIARTSKSRKTQKMPTPTLHQGSSTPTKSVSTQEKKAEIPTAEPLEVPPMTVIPAAVNAKKKPQTTTATIREQGSSTSTEAVIVPKVVPQKSEKPAEQGGQQSRATKLELATDRLAKQLPAGHIATASSAKDAPRTPKTVKQSVSVGKPERTAATRNREPPTQRLPKDGGSGTSQEGAEAGVDYDNALVWLKDKELLDAEEASYFKKVDNLLPNTSSQDLETRAKELAKTVSWVKSKGLFSPVAKKKQKLKMQPSPTKKRYPPPPPDVDEGKPNGKSPVRSGAKPDVSMPLPEEEDYVNALAWLSSKDKTKVKDANYFKKLESLLPKKPGTRIEQRAREMAKALKWVRKSTGTKGGETKADGKTAQREVNMQEGAASTPTRTVEKNQSKWQSARKKLPAIKDLTKTTFTSPRKTQQEKRLEEEDVDKALLWLNDEGSMDPVNAAGFKKVDKMLPKKEGQSKDERAKEMVKALNFLRKKGLYRGAEPEGEEANSEDRDLDNAIRFLQAKAAGGDLTILEDSANFKKLDGMIPTSTSQLEDRAQQMAKMLAWLRKKGRAD